MEATGLIKNGYVLIHGDTIHEIGSMEQISQSVLNDKGIHRIDAPGSLVMPGLINTHTHAAMTLFRGLADDLPLMIWLNDHIFPAEAGHVNPEMVYWCSKLAAAEMLLSGSTTCADGYFHEDVAAKAFMDAGMRAVVAQGVIDFPAPGVADPADTIKNASSFIEKWLKKSDLITPAVFAHSPYTCCSDTIVKAKQLASEHSLPFFIHVAETEEEKNQVLQKQGTTVVRYLDSLGICDEKTVCVHCVWIDAEEIEIMAQSKVKVATCTASNMKLAAGIAPIVEMLARNITVALGTDGTASNNTLDLFAEMALCAKLHKVHALDPTVLPAQKILTMATIDGASVLGLGDKVGALSVGKKADIIIIDLHQPHLIPFYSTDLLVYGARGADVSTVIINGNLVVNNRKILTFDVDETMTKVEELARGLR
jgi:5-methylthioadenosine/S-adenosylhomocysteine deaminase